MGTRCLKCLVCVKATCRKLLHKRVKHVKGYLKVSFCVEAHAEDCKANVFFLSVYLKVVVTKHNIDHY